jgi:hypothetical protein
MKPKRGHYSLVQYCPDPSRAEAANVGVLLFCPDAGFIEARTSAGNDRIRRFFGDKPFDPRQINAAKHAIEERLKVDREYFRTLEDLQQFVETRGNEIILTTPRPVKVFDPAQDLDQLFGELVGGRARRGKETKPIIPELDRLFRQSSLQDRIRFDEEITVPIVNRRMRIPYVWLNGEENYVRPEVFAGDSKPAEREAERLAIEGDLLYRNPRDGKKRRLVIVVANILVPDPEGLMGMMQNLFNAYSVKLIRKEQIEQYGEDIESQAH